MGGSCSTESSDVIVVHGGVDREAALVADGADTAALAEEGWDKVSQNLWVR